MMILGEEKPSVHKKFSEAQAILAGDSLHGIAFQLLSDKKLTVIVKSE